MSRSHHHAQSGFIMADTLAGLAILAAGLAAFLACVTQGQRLMRGAEDLRAWRSIAAMQIETMPAVGAPSGPAALRQAGVGLCSLAALPSPGSRPRPPVRTVRFCASGGVTP